MCDLELWVGVAFPSNEEGETEAESVPPRPLPHQPEALELHPHWRVGRRGAELPGSQPAGITRSAPHHRRRCGPLRSPRIRCPPSLSVQPLTPSFLEKDVSGGEGHDVWISNFFHSNKLSL